MLTIPDYIARLGIADVPVEYAWNDADPGAIHRQDERLATYIAKMSDRGVVALSCGFAEWIAWRLHRKSDVAVLLDAIEAVWAGLIDWRYLAPLARNSAAPRRKDWRGPVRGPVYATFDLLGDVVWRATRRTYTAEASTCLSTLAVHVLPDPTPFLAWRTLAINRLSSLYPFVLDDRVGPPVPRQALAPDFVDESDAGQLLLDTFLRSLDYRRNPFLRSPAEMIAEGFDATPYRL